ncbi:unnamed protein product [Rotaria magnacalcarata]|uniref:G-protein coupled receptors family 1 profile domain-containing protein n=1 Tax=Rotaria magnacalcarata TaxID=392030 RepID=A0A816LYW4_9BILA|nr:unnamed protein product [Rotaria magnacalcarata]
MNCSLREEIAQQIELHTYPFLLGLGTVGNLLSIVVLIQMRQHSVYRYLTLMAIADTVLLYIGLLRELLLSSSFHLHIQGTLLCKLHVFFFYVSPSTNIRDKVHLMRKTTGNNENDLPNQQTNYDDQNRSSCTNSINNLSLRKSSISQNFRNGRCRRNCASNHQSDTPDTTDDNNSNVTTKIVFHDRSQ